MCFYRLRNRVERIVSKLKQFRRVATRCDKAAASFRAFVYLAALRISTEYVYAALADRSQLQKSRTSSRVPGKATPLLQQEFACIRRASFAPSAS